MSTASGYSMVWDISIGVCKADPSWTFLILSPFSAGSASMLPASDDVAIWGASIGVCGADLNGTSPAALCLLSPVGLNPRSVTWDASSGLCNATQWSFVSCTITKLEVSYVYIWYIYCFCLHIVLFAIWLRLYECSLCVWFLFSTDTCLVTCVCGYLLSGVIVICCKLSECNICWCTRW